MPGVDVLYFGDAAQAAFMTGVLGGFGALFGLIVYKLGSDPRVRREEFRQLGGCSRGVSGLVGGAIFLAFASFGYWLYLTPFYAVEIAGPEIRLQKFYPTRSIALRRDEVARITRRNEVTKNNYVVTLVVHTTDGHRYESGLANPRQLGENFARLEAWMGGK